MRICFTRRYRHVNWRLSLNAASRSSLSTNFVFQQAMVLLIRQILIKETKLFAEPECIVQTIIAQTQSGAIKNVVFDTS